MNRWIMVAVPCLLSTAVWAEDEAPEVRPPPAANVLQLKWNDVKATKQVKPIVPPFAKLSMPIRCEIVFTIDEQGVPFEVAIEECPEALHRNATKAANKWRFEPVIREGQAWKASFKVILKITR